VPRFCPGPTYSKTPSFNARTRQGSEVTTAVGVAVGVSLGVAVGVSGAVAVALGVRGGVIVAGSL